jgi:hypothetical protein
MRFDQLDQSRPWNHRVHLVQKPLADPTNCLYAF